MMGLCLSVESDALTWCQNYEAGLSSEPDLLQALLMMEHCVCDAASVPRGLFIEPLAIHRCKSTLAQASRVCWTLG